MGAVVKEGEQGILGTKEGERQEGISVPNFLLLFPRS